jgi:hypothetical protein
VNLFRLCMRLGAASILATLCTVPSYAAPISTLQVRIVTGAQDLSAGSYLELRVYAAGKPVRHLPLTHGEVWPHDSTRVIPVKLNEPLDPREVVRFGLYYRSASPLTPPWEVLAADVEVPGEHGVNQKLLDATLTGTLSNQVELESSERESAAIQCRSDADCDDHLSCDGHERCAPRAAGADARGCVKGAPLVCPVNQVCTEARGCRGAEPPGPAAPAPAAAPEPAASSN